MLCCALITLLGFTRQSNVINPNDETGSGRIHDPKTVLEKDDNKIEAHTNVKKSIDFLSTILRINNMEYDINRIRNQT